MLNTHVAGYADSVVAIDAQISSQPGMPLPVAVRAKMEAFFGARFDDIRVHISSHVAALGAAACARGSALVFAPGRFDVNSLDGLALIGHELAHVVQQRDGRVKAATTSILCDAELEAEADRLGWLAAVSDSTRRAKVRGVRRASAATAQLPFQLKIEILEDYKSKDVKKGKAIVIKNMVMFSTLLLEMAEHRPGYYKDLKPQRDYYLNHHDECYAILDGWISEGMADFMGLHTRKYRDCGQVLRSVVAEHAARANLATEGRLANEAYASDKIQTNLAKALKAVWTKIGTLEEQRKAKIIKELGSFSCAYWMLYRPTWSCRNIAAYIPNPRKDWVTCNIAIYHDLMQYFLLQADGRPPPHFPKKTAGQGLIVEDESYATGSWEDIGITDEEWDKLDKNNIDLDELRRRGRRFRAKLPLKDDWRNNLATPNENKLVTQSGREGQMPMWASHSWTTLRMLLLTTWASGDDIAQREAVAWAIFALWNTNTVLNFSHPIHRFHEVMDIAENFGVAYTPFAYPAHAPV